jgi:hypothetical protein
MRSWREDKRVVSRKKMRSTLYLLGISAHYHDSAVKAIVHFFDDTWAKMAVQKITSSFGNNGRKMS